MKYTVIADVDQIVTKEVQLLIEAVSKDAAVEKARNALAEYPSQVHEDGVQRIVTNRSKYWIPRSIDFKTIEEEKAPA